MSATPQGRTAARPRFVLMTEDKAALLKIVGRHFDGHTIANQSLDPLLLHLACRVSHDLVAGIEVNAIARIRQNLDHEAFELDEFFLGHFFIPSDSVLHAARSKARPMMRSRRPSGRPGPHKCKVAARYLRRPLSRSRPRLPLQGSAGRTWCQAGYLP